MNPTPAKGGEPFRANPVLRREASASGQPRRSPVAASVMIHVVLVAIFLVLPGPFFKKKEPEPLEIVFYSPEELERPVPAPPEPEPPVERVERIVRNEPIELPEAEPLPPPVTPEPEKPKPQVRTEVFKTQQSSERPKVASRPRAQTGTFGEDEPEPEPRRPPRPERTVAAVGFADESTDSPDAGPGQRGVRVVASGSFTDGAMAVPREGTPPRRGGTVTRTAFVSEPSDESAPARDAGEVNRGGFEIEAVPTRPSGQRRRSVEVEELDTPVEIVSKPKPVYTDQARDLRIEGEVVLEVTFVSTGQLRVLRVLGSLGHGLDEAAVEAARNIEFTPARSNGRAVDHTATLRVVFRLA